MKVIVGLGNPGLKYQFTRHNLGFMVIDRLAGEEPFQKKHSSLILKKKNIFLVKPQTFMNLSGQAVQQILSFYKLPLDDLIVIHDDKDLDFGVMRFQKNRGHGGHNGIRNIHQALQSQNYCRLKLGIFYNNNSLEAPLTSDLVLSPFSREEQAQIPNLLDKTEKALYYWIKEGYEKSSNQFNTK